MGKLRIPFALFFIFALTGSVFSQDTLHRHGFSDYREAADSIWVSLAYKKCESLQKYTICEKDFVVETRKTDTVVLGQMIHGQWLNYYYKVDKSFRKVYKQLRKEKIDFKKAKQDTILLYKNTGNKDINQAEMYFVRNKKRGYIKYELWRVNDLWYFSGIFDYVNDAMPPRMK